MCMWASFLAAILTMGQLDQVGFLAAVFNNGIDCVQNVFSKKLLSTHYNYVNLQVRARARVTVRVRVSG